MRSLFVKVMFPGMYYCGQQASSGSAQAILRPFEGRKGAPYVWTTLKWSCLRSFGQTRQRWRTEFVFWATIVACMPKLNNLPKHQRPLASCLKLCAMGKTAAYSILNVNSLGDTSSGDKTGLSGEFSRLYSEPEASTCSLRLTTPSWKKG